MPLNDNNDSLWRTFKVKKPVSNVEKSHFHVSRGMNRIIVYSHTHGTTGCWLLLHLKKNINILVNIFQNQEKGYVFPVIQLFYLAKCLGPGNPLSHLHWVWWYVNSIIVHTWIRFGGLCHLDPVTLFTS